MCEGGKKCCTPHWLGWVLVVIGSLNWGLIGLSGFFGGGNWNVVNLLLGSWPMVEWAVYVLVGLSALMLLKGCNCKTCSSDMMK
ncbi:MAG: DUF378 domain-containing protein [Candidatus Vogelbacteria bacterium]|nr:DUF378 domain-containing protein [Candidatus Vogelbacteria bacterium]